MPPEDLSLNEVNILAQAASILNCSVSQLYSLDNRRAALSHLSAPYSSYSIPSKRQRLSTDLTAMPPPHETHEKSSAVDHDVSGTQGESLNGFTLGGIGPSRALAQCFANFPAVCSPCITCEPQGL